MRFANELKVVGLVDIDLEALRRAADVYGLSPEVMFEADDDRWRELRPDLVIDSSPPWLHLEHAIQAFEIGADLIVSKPLALDADQAAEIVSRADAGCRSLWVAQQMRYFPCFLEVRRMLAVGEIGAIEHVAIEMTLDGRGWPAGHAWRADLPEPLLTEAGIHHVDLIRWVLDDELADMRLWTWNPSSSPFRGNSSAAGLITTRRDVPVTYFASFAPNGRESVRFDSGWTVTGSTGTIVVADGGVLVCRDGSPPQEVLPPSEVPVGLDVLNERVLHAVVTGNAQSLSGTENLRGLIPLLASTVRS
ncbi:Gfo/Idh/MocA family oxidoreductase [Microbacterium sp. A8/3-1]|uniref:Gfo/Idh/MocA family oxidoreductase n=1 Tax=Microbacterium sp. A8/3-1 TaxID=3160749 RepID=A0AAU7W052_9MICO